MQVEVAFGGPTIYFDDSKHRRLRMSIIHELIIRKTFAKTKKRKNMLCLDFQDPRNKCNDSNVLKTKL